MYIPMNKIQVIVANFKIRISNVGGRQDGMIHDCAGELCSNSSGSDNE